MIEKETVDARAETPDRQAMHGVAGLKQHLLANKDKVMHGVAEKLFSYALGREVRYLDRGRLDALLKESKQNDYRLQDLILDLAASDPFAKR